MALGNGSLLGIYAIESSLGSGGMGEVYRARDERLNRTVAIKVLLPARAGDRELRARFLEEARAASQLNHPNIITIHDIGCEDGRDYLVMEYVSGRPLDELIPKGGLRSKVAIEYALQIASAMSAAHRAGIVHRDLKPANVMVSEQGLVKVLDFGLAKIVAQEGNADETGALGAETTDHALEAVAGNAAAAGHTREGRIVGTAAYMSPEQAEGGRVDARSDIFAFGCVFYEMLTGTSPFKRASVVSSLSAVLRDEPKPLREVDANLSGEMQRVVQRCLRKEPERRFQSAADLRVVLQELKEESSVDAPVAIAEGQAGRAGRRVLGWKTWAGVGVGIALAVAAGWYLSGNKRVETAVEPTEAMLSSSPGYVGGPQLSHDGTQVAFVWDGGTGGATQVYVKVVGTGEPLRLTNGTEYASHPLWSPDGSSIAYESSKVPGMYMGAGIVIKSPVTRILTMSALGGTSREVFSYEGYPSGFCWSRDGRSLMVSTGETVYAVTLESRERRKIVSAPGGFYRAVALSPDGHTLALLFARARSDRTPYLLKIGEDGSATDTPQLLKVSQVSVNSMAWLPDSKALIYGGSMSMNGSSLWRISVADDVETRLGKLGENGLQPTVVGPSGSHGGRMVYVRETADTDIFRIPMERGHPGAPVPLIATSQREWEPHYSPDGKRIAFTSDRGGLTDIWVANADGFEMTQVTNLKGIGTAGARWSPDGRQIAFLTKKDGQSEIYVVDAQGGTPVRITNNPAHDTAPMWSPDGRWLYFASNRGGSFELWKAEPKENAAAVQVTHHGGYAMEFSVDGKAMFYMKDNPTDGLWMQRLVNGEPSGDESQVLAVHLSNWGNFDVTRDGIVFVPVETGAGHVYFYRFADKSTTVVGTFAGGVDFGVSVSPADGSILFTQVNKPRRELVLVENFK